MCVFLVNSTFFSYALMAIDDFSMVFQFIFNNFLFVFFFLVLRNSLYFRDVRP